jgi:SAM-dependent methyltransferase
MPLQTEEWTQKEVAFLARQLPLPRYTRVLDLCCGYGRHALPLAALGYAVTGLDRDAGAIAEARRRATEASQAVDLVIADMRQVGELPGVFDAVINMWQSFSYFDEPANRDLLRKVHAKLTDQGRLVIDLYHRQYFERHAGHSRREIDGIMVDTEGYMEGNRWHAVLRYADAHGARGGDHMEWQLFTLDEFAALAAACGFDLVLACAWADEAQAPAAEIARMQVVLRKA